jgi:hypothetical protein
MLMRRAAFVVLTLLLTLSACKGGGSAKLEGHWRGTRAEGVRPEITEPANRLASEIEILAKGNQIAVSTSGKKQQSSYVVDSEDKSTVVIHTEADGAKAKETFVVAEDGKTMVWKLGDGRTIHFTKVTK